MHTLIQSVAIGDNFDSVYCVESAFQKLTVHGKKFTDFTLRDKSGSRNVKFWGTIDVKSGNFVFITARVEDYMGNPSIIASHVEIVDEPEDLSDFIQIFNDYDKHFERFDGLKSALDAGDGFPSFPRKFVEEVFSNGNLFQKFSLVPVDTDNYYGRQGGLLARTVRLTDTALSLAEFQDFSVQDRLYLIAAALTCQLGAVDCYKFENCIPIQTKQGMLFGVGGSTISRLTFVLKRMTSQGTIEEEPLHRIFHSIFAFYNLVSPATKDAIILLNAIKLDSELSRCNDFMSNDLNGDSLFTARDTVMNRQYYLGK